MKIISSDFVFLDSPASRMLFCKRYNVKESLHILLSTSILFGNSLAIYPKHNSHLYFAYTVYIYINSVTFIMFYLPACAISRSENIF